MRWWQLDSKEKLIYLLKNMMPQDGTEGILIAPEIQQWMLEHLTEWTMVKEGDCMILRCEGHEPLIFPVVRF
jgi:hypothetical protein